MDTGRPATTLKRRRPAKSCEPCRLRKIRCDLTQPCGACRRSRGPTNCTYRSVDGCVTANGTEIPSSAKKSRLRPAAAKPQGDTEAGSGQEQLSQPVRHANATPEDSIRGLSATYSGAEKGTATPPAAAPSPAGTPYQPNLRLRNGRDKTRLFGPSHWMYTAEILPSLLGSFDNKEVDFYIEDDGSLKDLVDMFGEVRHIRHIVKAGNAGISESSLMTLLESFPSGDLCFELLSAYFRLLQPIYRIIHVPSFWADYEQFCQEPQRMETLFVMQLALLYAIGTSFYAGPDKIEVQERARTWIDLVQSWIVGPAAKTTHNLAGLQVYCLLILSKQMVYNAGGLTWISSGSLLTMAMSMGLHQDPLLFPSLTPFQVEMRRRLWAATLELYVQHHVDSSIALTLRPSDIEMPEFLNLDDKDLGKDATTTPKSKEGITDASIQIQLTESLALRLEVAHMVNALHQECSFDTALELAEQFKAACRKLSDLFRLMDSRGGDDGDSAPRHFQRKFLDAMLRKYIILIHRPFMIMSRSSPALYLSRKTCVDAAKIIVSHLDGKPGTEELMRLAAAGRGSFKGPLSQNIVMVLSLELFMLLQEDDGVRQVGAADPMDIVQQEARDAVYRPLERICKQAPEVMRAGSVCTGTYNFVAAMLAQARATEAGQCTKMAVNGSIRESLKVTLAILHTNYPLLVKRSLANTGHAEKEKPFLALDSSYDLINWDISDLLCMPDFEE